MTEQTKNFFFFIKHSERKILSLTKNLTVVIAVLTTHTGNHSFHLTKILGFDLSISFYFALIGDGKQLVTIFCARPLHVYLDTY